MQENILITSLPRNTNKLSTVRLFLWPWGQQCGRAQIHIAKPSSPHRTEQLYSSSSLQAVPGPLCPPNHGPALSRGGLLGLDQNHANTSTACVTIALQDSTQSLPGPRLDYLCRCSLWDKCSVFLELHRARRWVPKPDYIWCKEELSKSDKR